MKKIILIITLFWSCDTIGQNMVNGVQRKKTLSFFNEWKVDTLGCKGLRSKYLDSVFDVRGIKPILLFNGLTKKGVEKYLGKPENPIKYDDMISYFVENIKCNKNFISNIYLNIHFKKGKVVSCGVAIE